MTQQKKSIFNPLILKLGPPIFFVQNDSPLYNSLCTKTAPYGFLRSSKESSSVWYKQFTTLPLCWLLCPCATWMCSYYFFQVFHLVVLLQVFTPRKLIITKSGLYSAIQGKRHVAVLLPNFPKRAHFQNPPTFWKDSPKKWGPLTSNKWEGPSKIWGV